MRIVTLKSGNQERTDETHPMNVLMEDLAAIEKQGGRIYRTTCLPKNWFVTLTTTNKEIHLHFGTMSWSAQKALCEVLLAEHRRGPCQELMLKNLMRSELYVTFQEVGNDMYVFNFSPAQPPSAPTH